MQADRITANLPSRDFAATEAFYAALGFQRDYRDTGWMILSRGPLEVEFFPWADLDPFASNASACVRVADLDGLLSQWRSAGLSDNPRAIPRLTGIVKHPGVPRMFALVDADGSLLRVLENEGAR
jgi:catechol 2,3-dioxygenase-like lactoylglutathione lyase family enzyme